VEESCAAERALAGSLQDAPARIVEHGEIAAIVDGDARDNWFSFLAFRDRVLASPDIESAWLELFLDGLSGVAPLFVPQLTQIILHGLLEDCEGNDGRADVARGRTVLPQSARNAAVRPRAAGRCGSAG
jgi:hypothetical protein